MEPTLSDKAIVTPLKNSRTPQLGPGAVLVSTRADFNVLRRRLHPPDDAVRNLFTGHLYVTDPSLGQFAVAGPLMGAPAAVMFLETLIAWVVRRLLYFGWCGSIASHVKCGDIIVPTGAFIDEGTSLHYHAERYQTAAPSPAITADLKQSLRAHAQPFHEGPVWTTDAIFRETPAKVTKFQQQGALGVEMEASALFTVANFHNVALGCILVVSDELATLTWQPGFKDARFVESRAAISAMLADLGQALSMEAPDG